MKHTSFEELVDREARQIAQGFLEVELQKLDLPLPKDSALDIHIQQLLGSNPGIRDQAKARVLASKDAYSDSLRAIGLEPTGAIDLDAFLETTNE